MAGTPLIKHSWSTVVKDDAGSQLATAALIILGSNEFNEKVVVPAGQTTEIDCGSINKDKISSVVITSNQPLTVNTNAVDASGGQAIALSGSTPFAWNNQEAAANPVTTSITKIFAINSGGKDATLTVAILLNLIV